MQQNDFNQITKRILEWYSDNQRDLPWRHTHDPYRIWVSEVMLQQTQVDTVIPYYRRFFEQFPSIHALASASLHEVLKVWENMGYYTRARNLHAAAQKIMIRWDGKIPDNWEDLISLPGIGHYMAGAILSIAFDQCFPAIDGNVRRVISRLFAIKEPINQPQTQNTVSNIVKALLPEQGPGQFNQAFMDLGATLCIPKKPDCKRCPLNNFCQARERQLQHLLPVTNKRGPIPHNHMVAGIIQNTCHGQILITQRKAQGLLGGLWKIPGGKQNPGENSEIALKREIRDELGILIQVGKKITSVNHAYTHFRITLHTFHCTLEAGEPKALGCSDWRWITLASFHHFAFSKVDRMVIQSVLHSPLPCFT